MTRLQTEECPPHNTFLSAVLTVSPCCCARLTQRYAASFSSPSNMLLQSPKPKNVKFSKDGLALKTVLVNSQNTFW